ncbi:hypothetical protein, partial [Tropicimonas sp. IMCC6043]|uniref:hypothetical protein n=1 Tax=Tropicimonas sp. IMCC6043 TaxID=2510645 RepID=UPI001A9390D1
MRDREPRILEVEPSGLGIAEEAFDGPSFSVDIEDACPLHRTGDNEAFSMATPLGRELESQGGMAVACGKCRLEGSAAP